MHPILFQIGSFKLHSFGVLMVLAFFGGLWLARLRAKRFGIDPQAITDACFYTLLFGILGARVAFIAQELPHYLANPRELFSWQFQGLTSFGGILFGFAYLVLWAKRKNVPLLNLLDLMAGPMLLGQAIGRVGCLMNGCCYGGACTLPWAVHVEGLPGLYHPAQIYESLMDLTALAILMVFERRGLARGQSLSLMLILYGAARFIYEFWRAGSSSDLMPGLPITLAQAVAGAMIVLGGALLVVFRNKAAATQEIPA